jgi:hypothetical protein
MDGWMDEQHTAGRALALDDLSIMIPDGRSITACTGAVYGDDMTWQFSPFLALASTHSVRN